MNLKQTYSFNKAELLSGILVVSFIFLLTFSSRQYRLSSNKAFISTSDVNLIVPEQIDIQELAVLLDSLSITFDKKELEWSSKMLGWRSFKKGNYLLSGSYSYDVLLSKLARGIQDPVSVVILPGITLDKLAESLSTQTDVTKSEVLELFNDSTFLSEINKSREELFGRMLPETYLMYWTSSPKDIVRRVLKEFDSSVARFDSTLKESEITIDEALTMASIVEWEAYNESEKARISGLYWNRINNRMRLQADPTINFALGERRRLLFKDYEIEHPFNTYLYRGLPPGPITNPSLNTIEAAVHPEEHSFIYMVANPEGGHIFTRTFEDHQVESEKWRRWLRQQYRIKKQREAEESL